LVFFNLVPFTFPFETDLFLVWDLLSALRFKLLLLYSLDLSVPLCSLEEVLLLLASGFSTYLDDWLSGIIDVFLLLFLMTLILVIVLLKIPGCVSLKDNLPKELATREFLKFESLCLALLFTLLFARLFALLDLEREDGTPPDKNTCLEWFSLRIFYDILLFWLKLNWAVPFPLRVPGAWAWPFPCVPRVPIESCRELFANLRVAWDPRPNDASVPLAAWGDALAAKELKAAVFAVAVLTYSMCLSILRWYISICLCQ
jgi:hypothetical protein